jgi:hypothetical protein
LRDAKIGNLNGYNQLRKISLGFQVSTLLTYMLGFIALKLSGSKKKGSPKHGNSFQERWNSGQLN